MPRRSARNAGLAPAAQPDQEPDNAALQAPPRQPAQKSKSKSQKKSLSDIVPKSGAAVASTSSQELDRALKEKQALEARVRTLEAQVNLVPASNANVVQENPNEAQEDPIPIDSDDGVQEVQLGPAPRVSHAPGPSHDIPRVSYRLPPPLLPAHIEDPEYLDEHLRQLDVHLKLAPLKPGQYLDILLSTVHHNRKIRQWLLRYAQDHPLCTKEECLTEFRSVFLSHMRSQTEIEHQRLFSNTLQQNCDGVAYYNSEFKQCMSKLPYLDQRTLMHFYHMGLHPTIRQNSRLNAITGEPFRNVEECMRAAIASEKIRIDRFLIKRPTLAGAPHTDIISSFYSSQEKFRQMCIDTPAKSPHMAPATTRNAKRPNAPFVARSAGPSSKRVAAAPNCDHQYGPAKNLSTMSTMGTQPPPFAPHPRPYSLNSVSTHPYSPSPGSNGGPPRIHKHPSAMKKGSSTKCWHCGNLGHRQEHCREYKAALARASPNASLAHVHPHVVQNAALMFAQALSNNMPHVAHAAPAQAPIVVEPPAPPALITKHLYKRVHSAEPPYPALPPPPPPQ